MPRFYLPFLIGLLATICACVDGSESAESDGPGAPPIIPESFADDPSLSLGGAAASGPTQFAAIQSVLVTQDSSIWVADGQSQEIRIFDRSGQHRATLGGRGDGPGEFRNLRLTRAPGDNRVAAVDRRAGRVTFYTGGGRLLGSERWTPTTLVEPVGFNSSGSLVAVTQFGIPISALGDGAYQDTAHVLAWDDLAAEPDTITTVPGTMVATRPDGATLIPFSIHPHVTVSDGTVLITGGPDFTVLRTGSQGARSSWSATRDSRPRTSATDASYRAFVQATFSESAIGDALEALDHPAVPAQLPGYDRLVPTVEGGLWARIWAVDRAQPRDWDVFDPAGVFMGTITSPAGFEPHDIRGGFVTGVRRDDLGVEYLERYALSRR